MDNAVHTGSFRDPNIASNLFPGCRFKSLDVVLFRSFLGLSGPGECSFEHAAGANVSIITSPLLVVR